ncbi:MAG TPA: DUF1684 domain-containing protein [Vicinamibacterales bacterium]
MRVLALAIALAIAAEIPGSYRDEIDKFRRDRIAEVAAPDGWLAVRGLFWLHEGPNVAGSDPSSSIVLPARAPRRVGTFTLQNGTVTFTAEPGSTVSAGGKPISTYAFKRGDDSGIRFSGITIAAIRRGDKFGLRMWDPESPNRTQFQGLKYFALNPAYRLRAKFVAYDRLKPVQVPNVLGQLVTLESPGYVRFTIDGRRPTDWSPSTRRRNTKTCFSSSRI